VLTVPVRALNASAALAAAKATATDLLTVLALTFNGDEFVVDSRQVTGRTDAVYQADGPVPPFDVAEGGVTEAGASELDTGPRSALPPPHSRALRAAPGWVEQSDRITRLGRHRGIVSVQVTTASVTSTRSRPTRIGPKPGALEQVIAVAAARRS
jgi:hypothetical protein